MHVLNYHHSTLSFDARGENDKFKYQCANTLGSKSFAQGKIGRLKLATLALYLCELLEHYRRQRDFPQRTSRQVLRESVRKIRTCTLAPVADNNRSLPQHIFLYYKNKIHISFIYTKYSLIYSTSSGRCTM